MNLISAAITTLFLHGCALALLHTLPNKRTDVQSRFSRVQVKLVSTAQIFPERVDSIAKTEVSENTSRVQTVSTHQVRQKRRPRRSSRVYSHVEYSDSKRADPAPVEMSHDRELDRSTVVVGSAPSLPHSDSDVAEVFSPCRQLKLPESWLNTPGLFPRLYEVDFNFPVRSGASVFNVVALRPEADALKYADNAIMRSFESCVNELGPESIRTLRTYFDKYESVTEGVFSFKIEFQTALGADSKRKGI